MLVARRHRVGVVLGLARLRRIEDEYGLELPVLSNVCGVLSTTSSCRTVVRWVSQVPRCEISLSVVEPISRAGQGNRTFKESGVLG